MGTRHLVKVTYNKENVIAQFGSNDGYPSWAGIRVCEFLQSRPRYNRLKEKAQMGELKFITAEEKSLLYEHLKHAADISPAVGAAVQIMLNNSQFSGSIGADILEMAVHEYSTFYSEDSSDFEDDALFCEYVYHIDLNKNTLTIYRPAYRPCYEKMRRTYRISTIQEWTSEELRKKMSGLEKKWDKICLEPNSSTRSLMLSSPVGAN